MKESGNSTLYEECHPNLTKASKEFVFSPHTISKKNIHNDMRQLEKSRFYTYKTAQKRTSFFWIQPTKP